MRKTVPALLVVALVPALIVLPVVTPVRPKPHAVAPHIVSEALHGVDASSWASLRAARTTGGLAANAATVEQTPAVLTPALTTAKYQLVGLTWSIRAVHDLDRAGVPTGRHSGAWSSNRRLPM